MLLIWGRIKLISGNQHTARLRHVGTTGNLRMARMREASTPHIRHLARPHGVYTLAVRHEPNDHEADRGRRYCVTESVEVDIGLLMTRGINTIHLPPSVMPIFITAGWHSGRCVDVDVRVPRSHPAHSILEEMGGLHVGHCGLGVECATSDLDFCFCEVPEDIVVVWSKLLRSKLVKIAEVHHRHGWLLVDETGRCFGASQIHDAFYYEGPNFAEAAERLLLGRKARPMLRPDQHEVDLYGKTFARGNDAIFPYDP
jgi:hypothetical protein